MSHPISTLLTGYYETNHFVQSVFQKIKHEAPGTKYIVLLL